MRSRGTHPPCAQQAEQYRRSAQWLPARTTREHIEAIRFGESRSALVDDAAEWSYAQLASAVANVHTLLVTAQIDPSDAVLIVVPLRNAAVAGYLGTLYCGAVAVLLDRRSGVSDLANAVDVARPRVALAFDADARRLELHRHLEVLSLDQVTPTDLVTPTRGEGLVDPDAPATVVFTSGTTSAPKGVVHTINSLRCGTANMITALEVTGDDAFFLSSPLASITGVLQLHSALATHAKVILEEKFSPTAALSRVREHGATVIGGAPAVVESLFAEADQHGQSLGLRCIAVGGTMIPRAVLDTAARFGVSPVRVYGSSEAPFSTSSALGGGDATVDDGTPLAGVEIAIRDAGGADELIIRGPHQFHGYLDAEHNDDAFADGWLRTGDQADIHSGRMRIKGRLKEIVIRKGMKISLAEIDSAAAGLGDCAAFAVADDETGERLALAVRAGVTDPDIAYVDVVEHLTESGLAKWKLPEQIVVWEGAYPRTASGKIIRNQLTDQSRHLRTIYAPRLARG